MLAKSPCSDDCWDIRQSGDWPLYARELTVNFLCGLTDEHVEWGLGPSIRFPPRHFAHLP